MMVLPLLLELLLLFCFVDVDVFCCCIGNAILLIINGFWTPAFSLNVTTEVFLGNGGNSILYVAVDEYFLPHWKFNAFLA